MTSSGPAARLVDDEEVDDIVFVELARSTVFSVAREEAREGDGVAVNEYTTDLQLRMSRRRDDLNLNRFIVAILMAALVFAICLAWLWRSIFLRDEDVSLAISLSPNDSK